MLTDVHTVEACQASALRLTPCLLHAAAPRMLEALRALYELAPLSNDDAVQRVYSEVRAILRDVER